MLERIDYVEGRVASVSQKLRMARKDYSREGWYFVTMGAEMHRPVFGLVGLNEQGAAEMRCNALGQLVEQCWREIPAHYPQVLLGAFQVMPDHFHGLVWLDRGNISYICCFWRLTLVRRHGILHSMFEFCIPGERVQQH